MSRCSTPAPALCPRRLRLRPRLPAPAPPPASPRWPWLLALAATLTAPLLDGCEYRPKYQLLYPQGEGGERPDLGNVGDGERPDPGVFALYDRACDMCHPDYGRRRGEGPELAGVLTHNSREETQRFSRFGGGEMVSLETEITDDDAVELVKMLASYGEGFAPPPTGRPEQGVALFAQRCAGCHAEGGAAEQLIPELDTLGQVSRQLLVDLLGRQMGAMPALTLGVEEREATIRHVQALSRGEQPAAGDAAAFAAHCEPCHLEGGRRRLRVPTIGQGGWLSPAGLRQLCVQGQGEMPAVVEELSPEQALDLQAYMRTVVTRRAAPGSWPPRPIAAASPAAAERGQALYQASCRACHGQAGEPRLVWPDLREAGYLHSERYLAEIVAHGAGAMPAYPGLEHSRLAEITAYLVALSSEVHQTGPGAGEPPPLYHELCEGCHQEGGRASGYVPDLASAGQDQSTQRLRTVIGEGFGAMGPVTLQPAAVDDLVAFFQRGLSPPAPSPAAIAAAKAAFGSYCGGCHHDDGLAPTQIPGVGDVLGRGASTSYIEDLIDEGLGWMPAIPAAAGVLVPLGEALAQAARNEQPSGAGLAAYDAHCRSCHREPTAGDEEAALVRPTPVTTVGGRLSPAFLHDLVGGLGAMARVDGLADADAALRPYLESVAAAPLRGPTAIPAGGDTGAARAAFDPLCGGCHREQGLAEVHMPRLAQKLRAKIPGTTYVKEFIARSDEFGSMPLLVLSGGERAQIEAYCTARGDGRAASEGARSVFARRCAGCHPESESDAAIVVPHLVPTARRLSARLVRQASLQGVGRMAVATHPDGRAPTEAEIDRVFPQLSWLADQQGKPFAERPLDRARIDRGKSRYTQLCATGACHAEGAVNLAPRQLGGRPFAPLEGLSAVLLEQVTRQGMGVVPGGLGGMPGFGDSIPAGEMADLLEYMLALGRGETP